MTGWLLLLVAVALSTLLWPVARWGLGGASRAASVGLCTSLAMAAASGVGFLIRHEGRPSGGVWIAAALLAIAYALGFWLLVMHALKIGPAAPTVTVNNMAMVCGVLYGVLYLHPHERPSGYVIAGAIGTCIALVLIGIGSGGKGVNSNANVPRRWLPMVIAGGAFSGLSFITQTYVGEVQRTFRFTFLMLASIGSAAILLPVVLPHRVTWREAIAGVSIGLMSAIGMLATLTAFRYLGSAIVLPFSVTTPVLLMLVIGHFAYRERLSRPQFAGTLVGALAVLLLALGNR